MSISATNSENQETNQDFVQVTPQLLDSTKQAQARANIGALAKEDVSNLIQHVELNADKNLQLKFADGSVQVISLSELLLNRLQLKGVVDTYADLASIANPKPNDAYQVAADNLVYIYTMSGFQAEGKGFDISLDPSGKVEAGDNRPVSGNEVFEAVNNPVGKVESGDNRPVSGGEVFLNTIKPADLVLGKNKFDKSLIKKGFYISNTNGSILTGLEGSWIIENLDISYFKNNIVISNINTATGIKSYSVLDSNNQILSFGDLLNGTTIINKLADAVRINFTIKRSTDPESVINLIQIEDGVTATEYDVPHIQGVKDKPFYLNKEASEHVISSIYGHNVLNENTRLDENTTITSNSAGDFQSLQSAVFSQGTDSLIVYPTITVYSGIRHPNILLKFNLNDYFILEFEARATTSNIPRIGIYPETGTSVSSIDLTNTFKKFKFKLRREAVMFNDGRLSICTNTSNQNFPFEIKNISIYEEKEINKLLDTVFPNENELISIVGDSISTAVNNNAYELEILASDVGNNISYHPTNLDYTKGLTIGGVAVTNAMVGVLTSFTPNSSDIGKKLGEPANYNTLPSGSVWWEKVISHFNWELCQNVSWSGATTSTNRSTGTFRGSYSWHDRTINTLKKRDVNGNWILPTKIIHYRGTNDFSYEPYARIDNQYNVTDGYATNDVRNDDTIGYKEAISIFIKKCRQEYPFAEIILCTLNNFKRVTYDKFPTRNPYNSIIDYNNAIRECAALFGCRVIEFDKCGITFENMYPTYINNSATIPTHPNQRGHEIMANKAIKDLSK